MHAPQPNGKRSAARSGAGVDTLRKVISCHFLAGAGEREAVVVTNVRHARALEDTRDSLDRAAGALRSGLSEEFALVDLHAALRRLGEITGETTVEDLLGENFSRFCIGK